MEKRLSFDRLIGFTFKTIGREIKAYGVVYLLLILLFAVNLAVIIGSLGGLDLFTGVIPVQHKLLQVFETYPVVMIASYVGILVLDLLFSVWLSGVLMLIALESDKENKLTMLQMFTVALQKMPGLLVYGIIFGALSLVAMLPYLYQSFAINFEDIDRLNENLVSLYGTMGISYFIIFVVSVMFIMSYPIYMDNKGGILAGLGEGYRQMKGHFWRTMLYLFVLYVLLFIVVYIVSLVIVFIGIAVAVTSIESGAMTDAAIMAILPPVIIFYSAITSLSMIISCNVRVGVYKQLYSDQVME